MAPPLPAHDLAPLLPLPKLPAHRSGELGERLRRISAPLLHARREVRGGDAEVGEVLPLLRERDRPGEKRLRWVGDDSVGIGDPRPPEPLAARAGALLRVEAEEARLELRQAHSALRAGETRRDEMRLAVDDQGDESVSQRDRLLDRLREARALLRREFHPVIDDFDRVAFVASEGDVLVETSNLPVDPHPHEALIAQLLKLLAVLPFAFEDDRRADEHVRTGPIEVCLFDDPVDGVALDDPVTLRTMRGTQAREEQAEVIEDLGDRPFN